MQLEFNAEIAKTIKKELGISCFPNMVESIRNVMDALLWRLFKFLIPV